MTDYPRFRPVEGGPGDAYTADDEAPIVSLAFRAFDSVADPQRMFGMRGRSNACPVERPMRALPLRHPTRAGATSGMWVAHHARIDVSTAAATKPGAHPSGCQI